MKAPNGKPTKLTERQWVQVRTPAFKAWFGDWEKIAKLQRVKDFVLNSTPVANLDGSEFSKAETSLVDRVVEYFNKEYKGEIESPVLGKVLLNKNGVKSSIAHGVGQNKASAFKAVPEVIKRGVVFNEQVNYKNRGYDTAVITAPISIADKEYICEIIVKKERDKNEFYLHEVELKDKVAEAFKTSTGEDTSTTSAQPVYSILARELASVNPDSVSKVVDENEEPLVVYHGSSQWFTEFNNGNQIKHSKAPDNTIFASSDKDIASSFDTYYGGKQRDVILDENSPLHKTYSWGVYREGGVYTLFFNIRNPKIVDFGGKLWNEIDFDINDIVKQAKEEGYDGVIANNIIDVGFTDIIPPPSTDYVAFSPNQIKSATDNVGTFSGKNNSILFQGYDWNAGMSNNAVSAYENGEKPISAWTKKAILAELKKNNADENIMNRLADVNVSDLKDMVLYKSSWHHTGKYFNRTDFYSLKDISDITEILDEYETDKPKYKRIIKEIYFPAWLNSTESIDEKIKKTNDINARGFLTELKYGGSWNGYKKPTVTQRKKYYAKVYNRLSSIPELLFQRKQITDEFNRIANDFDEEDFVELGTGQFGKEYTQGEDSPIRAAKFLLAKKSGVVKNAFRDTKFGDVGLAYGDEKNGLFHIIAKHIFELDDFDGITEAVETIEDVLRNGTQKESNTDKNKIIVVNNNYRVVLGKNKQGNYVVTSYDFKRKEGTKRRNPSDITLIDRDAFMKDGTLVPSEAYLNNITSAGNVNILFQSVYHGSGASFDAFDSSYMGTGEGAQAFGYCRKVPCKFASANLLNTPL